jgi:hypothetical protein
MTATQLTYLCLGVTVCSAILMGAHPLKADTGHNYTETGMVISVTADHGEVYKIETADKIYRMECTKAKVLQSTPPACEVAGRPIAVKDAIQFRFDDEDSGVAYIPASGKSEGKLLILSTELKVLPPLPATASTSAGESCAVLATGRDQIQVQIILGGSAPAFSMPPGPSSAGGDSPVIPSGPVTAIPVTGGPPVQVIANAPVSGGIVTGTPVTGGAPIVAVPVAPVTGTSAGATAPITSGSSFAGDSGGGIAINSTEWLPYLRLQTSNHVYKLSCQSNFCWIENQAPQLGDLLTLRLQGKVAYVSWQSGGPKGEQKFAIVSVDGVD